MLIKISSSRFGIPYEWDYPAEENEHSRGMRKVKPVSVHRRRLGLSFERGHVEFARSVEFFNLALARRKQRRTTRRAE